MNMDKFKLKSPDEFIGEGFVDWIKSKFDSKKPRKPGQKGPKPDTQMERDRKKALAKKKAEREEKKRRSGEQNIHKPKKN
jgi:hypothetical protein